MTKLSIVCIFFNMRREATRTLQSLVPPYQQKMSDGDYEIIAIDNGSPEPLDEREVTALSSNIKYHYIKDARPSPAQAINEAVRHSSGEHIGILIDGARMASPGLLSTAQGYLERNGPCVVGTIGFHLGPDIQTKSPAQGYTREIEDHLLDQINWLENGYRLFEISALAGSSRTGWLGRIVESNLLFMAREVFDRLGGYDERFKIPGGGLVNLDFYKRAAELDGVDLITLLGEATFHQMHGGTMTNRPFEDVRAEIEKYKADYYQITGKQYSNPTAEPKVYGKVVQQAIPWISQNAATAMADLKLPKAGALAKQLMGSNKSPTDGKSEKELAQKPGSKNTRAYVGRAENYDVAAGNQFSLLFMLGLRASNNLLDIGCGSLRGGRLFIPFLEKGKYYGIEPERWLVEEGLRENLGGDLVSLKRPRFNHNSEFDFTVFDNSFDFVLAQSILSHTGMAQMEKCICNVNKVLNSSGVFVGTFVENHKDKYVDEWVYPGLNHFTWKTVRDVCAHNGLYAAKLDWPHTLQTWFVGAQSQERLNRILENGVDRVPDDVVLTGHRFHAQNGTTRFRFYRDLADQ